MFTLLVVSNSVDNQLSIYGNLFATSATLANIGIFILAMMIVQTVQDFASSKRTEKAKKVQTPTPVNHNQALLNALLQQNLQNSYK